jgi:hypothetical protein
MSEIVCIWVKDEIRGCPSGSRYVELVEKGWKWVRIRFTGRKNATRIPRKVFDKIVVEEES